MSDPAPLLENAGWPATPGGQAYWLASDTGRLRYAVWQPEGDARGTVVLMHGLSEHIEKHYETAARLLKRNFAVAILDRRGHGMSTPMPQEMQEDFAVHDDDLRRFMEEVVIGKLPEPYVAMGHSLGGCFACCMAHDHPGWFKAVVLCAPMLGINVVSKMPFMPLVGKFMSSAPKFIRDKFASGQLMCFTTDQKRFDRYAALMKEHRNLMPSFEMVDWFNSANARLAEMRAEGWYRSIETPVFIALAEYEDLTSNQDAQDALLNFKDASNLMVKRARHEIMMELDMIQEDYWGAVDSFLGQHVPYQRATATVASPPPSDASDDDSDGTHSASNAASSVGQSKTPDKLVLELSKNK